MILPKKQTVILAFTALLIGVLACAVPSEIVLQITPTPVVITQIVMVTTGPEEQMQVSPTSQPLAVPPSIATDTLIPDPTAAVTQDIYPLTTPTGTIATFVKDANCRQGPGTEYEVVTSFFKGETVQIVGRSPDFQNTWWYVDIPSGGKCWVSLVTARAYGDLATIPTVEP